METTQTAGTPRRSKLLNLALAANAVLVGVLLMSPHGPAREGTILPAAQAAPPAAEENEANSRVNPADQRKQMISQLDQITQRLTNIENTLKKGISVKVTEMPRQDAGDRKAAAAPAAVPAASKPAPQK